MWFESWMVTLSLQEKQVAPGRRRGTTDLYRRLYRLLRGCFLRAIAIGRGEDDAACTTRVRAPGVRRPRSCSRSVFSAPFTVASALVS